MKVSPRTAARAVALLGLVVALHAPAFASTDVRSWGVPGDGHGQMRSPFAIARAGDRVYVADFDNDRIQVFTRAGEALLDWGGTGSEPGQFRGPAGVAIGPDGSVFVTDHYNHRIQRFTPEGGLIASWSAGGDDAAPFGIAVDRGGRVYVTDLEAGRVRVWTTDGAALTSFGIPGHGRGELDEPWGVAVDAQGEVFVADHGNDRVVRFTPDGAWLGEWSGAAEAELLGPMALALGRDGSVYVTDLAGVPMQHFTRDGDLVATSSAAPITATGLTLDAGGDLLLVDPLRQQVVRVPGAQLMSPTVTPAAFAMMPIAQPMGRGAITLDFAIPAPGTLAAEIFSIDGRRVYTVAGVACDPGARRITWDAMSDDGHRAPVGMYFIRAQFDDGVRRITRTGRAVVLR